MFYKIRSLLTSLKWTFENNLINWAAPKITPKSQLRQKFSEINKTRLLF